MNLSGGYRNLVFTITLLFLLLIPLNGLKQCGHDLSRYTIKNDSNILVKKELDFKNFVGGYHLGRIYEVFEFEEHKEILSFCQYALVDNQVVESTFLKVVSVKENRILDESSLLVVTNQFDFNLQCPSIRNDCVLVTEIKSNRNKYILQIKHLQPKKVMKIKNCENGNHGFSFYVTDPPSSINQKFTIEGNFKNVKAFIKPKQKYFQVQKIDKRSFKLVLLKSVESSEFDSISFNITFINDFDKFGVCAITAKLQSNLWFPDLVNKDDMDVLLTSNAKAGDNLTTIYMSDNDPAPYDNFYFQLPSKNNDLFTLIDVGVTSGQVVLKKDVHESYVLKKFDGRKYPKSTVRGLIFVQDNGPHNVHKTIVEMSVAWNLNINYEVLVSDFVFDPVYGYGNDGTFLAPMYIDGDAKQSKTLVKVLVHEEGVKLRTLSIRSLGYSFYLPFVLKKIGNDDFSIVSDENFSFEGKLKWQFEVTACYGESIRCKSKRVFIQTFDRSLTLPVFGTKYKNIQLDRKAKVGKIVGSVGAIVKWAGRKEIYYSIASKTKYFSVDKNRGFIYLIKELDSYEEHRLTITATNEPDVKSLKLNSIEVVFKIDEMETSYIYYYPNEMPFNIEVIAKPNQLVAKFKSKYQSNFNKKKSFYMWDIDELNKYNLVSQYLELNSQTGILTISPHVQKYLTRSNICLNSLTVLVYDDVRYLLDSIKIKLSVNIKPNQTSTITEKTCEDSLNTNNKTSKTAKQGKVEVGVSVSIVLGVVMLVIGGVFYWKQKRKITNRSYTVQ